MTMPDDYEVVTDQDYNPDIKMGVPQDEWLDKDTQSLGISLPPELCSLSTFQITQFGSSGGQASGVQGSATTGIVRILQRRLTRHRARIWIPSLQSTGGTNPTPSQPAVPASGVAVQNTNLYPVDVTITGGTVTAVVVNGVTVGTGDGTYLVPVAGSISMTYSVAPTWVWADANPTGSPTTAVVLGRTEAEVQNGVAANGLQGSGLYIPAAMIPFGGGGGLPWENQRDCFATAIGGTATIIVLDESYAQDRTIDIRNKAIGAR
jgi:hypothetical protein